MHYELCTDPKYCKFIQVLQQRHTLLLDKTQKKLSETVWSCSSGWCPQTQQGKKTEFQTNKCITTFFFVSGWTAGHAFTFLVLLGSDVTQIWTFIPDGWTVINNVFPLWAIKYFHSGSLGWSAELKGASAVVVEELRIFGGRNFPSSLKQRWAATRRRIVFSLLPVMVGNRKHCFSSNIKYFSCFCEKFKLLLLLFWHYQHVKNIHSKSRGKQHITTGPFV